MVSIQQLIHTHLAPASSRSIKWNASPKSPRSNANSISCRSTFFRMPQTGQKGRQKGTPTFPIPGWAGRTTRKHGYFYTRVGVCRLDEIRCQECSEQHCVGGDGFGGFHGFQPLIECVLLLRCVSRSPRECKRRPQPDTLFEYIPNARTQHTLWQTMDRRLGGTSGHARSRYTRRRSQSVTSGQTRRSSRRVPWLEVQQRPRAQRIPDMRAFRTC